MKVVSVVIRAGLGLGLCLQPFARNSRSHASKFVNFIVYYILKFMTEKLNADGERLCFKMLHDCFNYILAVL